MSLVQVTMQEWRRITPNQSVTSGADAHFIIELRHRRVDVNETKKIIANHNINNKNNNKHNTDNITNHNNNSKNNHSNINTHIQRGTHTHKKGYHSQIKRTCACTSVCNMWSVSMAAEQKGGVIRISAGVQSCIF